jgi:GH24 family phage-related lysozyme (muramidase)
MSYESRYATTALINDIASFEGFLSTVTPDNLAGGIPTVGYGRVVYAGSSFYNGMTKKEAYAYLVKTVNESGFTSQTNKFLTENKIKFNQRQFDALVDFSYNLGAYALTNHEDLSGLLLDSYGKASNENKGFVNSLNVYLTKSAETSGEKIKSVDAGTDVTLVSSDLYNEKWYKVKLSDGTTGYMLKSKITLRTTSTTVRNLNNVSYKDFVKNFLPYHHSSGNCYYGLLYRRIDEAEMFFFGDYTANGKQNNYKISYNCSSDSSFKIG